MSGTQTQYTLQDQADLEKFVHDVCASEAKPGMVLDSASAADSALSAIGGDTATPRVLDELLGQVATGGEAKVIKAIFDGVNTYEREHGFRPTGDLLLSALHQGRSVFDAVENGHHDQISINPNAPIVAILGSFAEAAPFVGYLPADKGSNEARLIILSHQAGSDWGDYSQADLLDGILSGGQYLGSSRTMELGAPNDTANYKFAFKAQASGAGAALNLLRGRSIVYVNGRIAATEVANAPAAAASVPIVGSVKLDGTEYALSGTVKPLSGEVVITPTPALPNGTVVHCEVFVDYERDPNVTPRMNVQAQAFQLFASPYRALYQITPEARSQFANEVGVDAGAEAMLALRGQFAMERHYGALGKAKMIGKFVNPSTYDFEWAVRNGQMNRAQIWTDFQAHLGTQSQVMAEKTADHGITHLYVTKAVLAQWRALGPGLWEDSGIQDRPGIYRAGRLFGRYEVYYTPKGLNESADGKTAEILAVGRSSQTARCPIIFGDASAPMFEPLGLNTDLKGGYGFHARCFNAVNPHEMSAQGAALITVTNMK